MRPLFFLLAFGIIGSLLPASRSECCKHACCGLFRCCGVGPCNIFCCNCDDGCRSCTQSTFHTITGILSCIGCPAASVAAAGTAGAAAGAAAAACVSCGVAAGRRKRSVEDAQDARNGSTIMALADTDEDKVLDVKEAADFLFADGKLHADDVLSIHQIAEAGTAADPVETELPDWFKQVDTNGNGYIELGELDTTFR